MPGFGSSADTDGQFRATQLHINVTYDDGSEVSPKFEELMAGFRFSSARPSIDYMFHPDRNPAASTPPDDVVAWLTERATRIGHGETPRTISFCWQRTEIDLHTADAVPVGGCKLTEVQL